MGKLRTEPKVKTLDSKRYQEIHEILKEARNFSRDAHIYWDLEESESPAKVKKDFSYVAEKEGVGLKIRQLRQRRSLQLVFTEQETKQRLSADDAKERILSVLRRSDRSLKKSDILSATGISTSSWNMRIRELMEEKKVKRDGNRRDTVYTLL